MNIKFFQIILCYCLLVSNVFSQKQFEGVLTYQIEIADTSLRSFYPSSIMTIYTNDTLLRVETKTENLGDQILIHHFQKNKGYLLIQTALGKYAIQIPEDTTHTQKYTYKKTRGKQEILGLKSKKLLVKTKNHDAPLTAFYHKKISAKYIPGFDYFPGLVTSYQVHTNDGIYNHTLIAIERKKVDKDLFGIPSDYTRISMSDFVDLMTSEPQE
ncbi:MAG TPA: hypothetical protein VKZ44_03330 [Taishania sp.]|nr:hypothetical protein [Taishania sp.]